MAEITLSPAPRLGGVDRTIGTNRITERADIALVSVATPLGGEAELAEALQSGWGLDLPSPTASTVSNGTRALRTAPDQLFLMFPHDTPDAEPTVQAKLKGAGYTTDQSDNWVALELSGPETLFALERLCPLDVPGMADGDAARTVMEHMGAIILRLGPDRFLLLSASSSAESFLHAVELSYANVT